MIMREAERLDLMIPGMLGYVPMRERPAFVKSDGWRTPDWWDVRPDTEGEAPRDTGSGSDGANGSGGGKREEKNGDDRSCAVTEPAPPYSPTGRSSTLPPVTEDEAPVASSDLDSFGARGRVEVPDLDDLVSKERHDQVAARTAVSVNDAADRAMSCSLCASMADISALSRSFRNQSSSTSPQSHGRTSPTSPTTSHILARIIRPSRRAGRAMSRTRSTD
jgi:hypothetical protein